jgi:hypothetical protein
MRSLLVRIGLIVTVAVLILQIYNLSDPSKLIVNDSLEYWAAARLLIVCGNPYSPDEMLELQRTVGWHDPSPLMMWNPPWTLSIVMPLGFLPYSLAKVLWLFMLFIALFLSSDLSWQIYNGDPKYRWLAWLLGMTFFPTLITLKLLQIGPIMLLGVVCFIYFQKSNRPFMAGMACVLISIKPHFLYLFWIVLMLWVITNRQWRVVIGTIVGFFIIMAIPHVFNPNVLSQYLITIAVTGGPSDWASPTLGGYLRLLVGADRYWLQFVSLGIGLPWSVWYWTQRRIDWKWERNLPIVLMASIVTACYGWTYDQVVLIPLLIQVAIWSRNLCTSKQRNLLLICYTVVNLGILILRTEAVGMSNDILYGWVAPLIMIVYMILSRYLVDSPIVEAVFNSESKIYGTDLPVLVRNSKSNPIKKFIQSPN